MIELKDLHNAWLSPHGEVVVDDEHFYESYAFHEQLAVCIARNLLDLPYGKDVLEAINALGREHSYMYAYDYLEDIGWVRLQGWQGWRVKWIVPNRLTMRQQEVIGLWCAENGVTEQQAIDYAESF